MVWKLFVIEIFLTSLAIFVSYTQKTHATLSLLVEAYSLKLWKCSWYTMLRNKLYTSGDVTRRRKRNLRIHVFVATSLCRQKCITFVQILSISFTTETGYKRRDYRNCQLGFMKHHFRLCSEYRKTHFRPSSHYEENFHKERERIRLLLSFWEVLSGWNNSIGSLRHAAGCCLRSKAHSKGIGKIQFDDLVWRWLGILAAVFFFIIWDANRNQSSIQVADGMLWNGEGKSNICRCKIRVWYIDLFGNDFHGLEPMRICKNFWKESIIVGAGKPKKFRKVSKRIPTIGNSKPQL